MKTRVAFVTILVCYYCFRPPAQAEQVFPKEAEIRLTADTPHLFQNTTKRTGKAGETFTVIQHNTTTKRVYILTTDGTGKQIAHNVADTAVELVPFDITSLRATLLRLFDKTDFANATQAIEAAVSRAPNDSRVQEYRSCVMAAKVAYDKLLATARKVEAASQRVQQLARNAQVGNRTNPLTGDQSGLGRAQNMKQEADRITAAVNAESEEAKAGWDAAKQRVASALSQPFETPTPPNLAEKGKALSVPATPPVIAGEKEESPMDLAARKLVPDGAKAAEAESLKQGKFYLHYCKVLQVTNEFLMVDKLGLGKDQYGRETIEPWAVLVFADPKKMGGISVERGGWITAIAQFTQFKSIQLTSGAERRLALFTCVGFNDFTSGKYIDCSLDWAAAAAASPFARLGETPEQLAQRYGKPKESDSVGTFTRNIYEVQGYRNTVISTGNKSVALMFRKPDMSVDDAATIVWTVGGKDAFQPFPPGRFHVLTNDKNDLEVTWTWREGNPDFKQSAMFSPRDGILVITAENELWVEFIRAAAAASRK